MHVVHLVSSAQLGGTEASLIEMVHSLRAARPEWTFSVIAPHGGPLVERLARSAVPVDVLAFPATLAGVGEAGRLAARLGRIRLAADLLRAAPSVWRYRRFLRSRLVEHGVPDVVHAHGFKMQVLGALAVPRGALLVWHVHDYVASRPFSARLLRALAHRCALVVANSSSVADDVRSVLGAGVRVETIYNAIDLTRFTPEGPALDLDRLGGLEPPSSGTLRVGLLATFGRWKGHRTFLRAVAAISDLPVRAYVIGGTQYQTRGSQESLEGLRDAARDLGLNGRVVFTGTVSDAAAALRALDIVVHASTEPEPFGMVIAEAMACGRAVIVSGAGGAAELVEDGVDGVAHRPGDAAHLAERLRALAADPELRGRLGAAARSSAARRFDRDRLAVEIAPLYRLRRPA
jgi:glycosyltransferase involved in cell wall biosynthesis